MSFRFLHTADWQIGMKAAHTGRAAEQVREARLRTAERVIEIANAQAVEAVILAGDTFEDSSVPRDLVRRVVDILRKSAAPVFVLAGNHDPLVPKGVFDHLAWDDARPKVTVFRDGTPVAVGEADLFPCPLKRAHSVEDPLAAIPIPAGPRSRIRVGVAHGSLLGAAAPDEDLADDFPMDRRHARQAWLDYLALGHWHGHGVHEIEGVGRIAYSGTHEPTKFGEAAGGCLVVTIDAPGAVPLIEQHACAALEWRQRTETVSMPGDLERIRREIDAEPAASATRTLLDLTLRGAIGVAEQERLADLESVVGARFLYGRVRRGELRIRPDDQAWIDGLPAGAPRAAARALLAQAEREGREAAVAARALGLLFEMAGTGGR
jgi:DNA repair exonuclease SbcCD nuclease subunit